MPSPGAAAQAAEDVLVSARFLRALVPYLRSPLSPEDCRARIADQVSNRDASFLSLVRSDVYGSTASPYLALLRHAGVEYGDLERLVGREGVEGALGQLYDAGVRLTLDEFKGRRAIRRGQTEIAASPSSFDNRLPSQQCVAGTGGSRGASRRILFDLELIAYEACHEYFSARQLGFLDRPRATWRPVPPGAAGINAVLRFAKIGAPFDRWFSQNPVRSAVDWRHSLFTAGLTMAGRVAGRRLAAPEYVPVDAVGVVVEWLAACRGAGRPGLLDTTVASAVRVCRAAADLGRAIDGSVFRVGGEPYTAGKARVIERAGCRAYGYYFMAEVGRIAIACGDPAHRDDMHVHTDKLALLQRDVPIAGRTRVPALVATTLVRSTPKVMINVELGDYAAMTTRSCRCEFSRLGLPLHVHGVRSYEKLTADGMHFLGAEIEHVLDEVLPARFGGGPNDYQLIEREQDGLTTIVLRIDPRLGPVDAAEAASALLDALGASSPAHRMMARQWREAGLVRVERCLAEATREGKVLSLHVEAGRHGEEKVS